MPHVFLAGAHTRGAPLPELVDEIRAVERMLEPLRQRGLCQVRSNRAANLDDIFHTFSEGLPIDVFHYAGHAEGERLYLEEEGHIRGIAELFGIARDRQTPLRLVFLNGCATRGQVAGLHAAGVAAVIATSRPVGDRAARTLAEAFYGAWVLEEKTLDEAFQLAVARVHARPEDSARGIVTQREALAGGDFGDDLPWGLYLHPGLPEAGGRDWVLNPRPELPALLLAEVRPHATQRLRELVHEFRRRDPEAGDLIRRERRDPLLVLIERMPWIVGTHLRRLFAVDSGQTMTEPGRERLRELLAAYAELNRLLSYLALSLLWDARRARRGRRPADALPALPFDPVPDQAAIAAVDYVYQTTVYYDHLQQLTADVSDPLDLLPAIGDYLAELNRPDGLRPGYLFMEELRQALAAGDDDRLNALLLSRAAGRADGEQQLVLEAEAIYVRFLQAALFLTRYRLHTVRSIVVDKLRNLPRDRPYSHFTITLHAAFGKPRTLLTERETATDNYCLLLTRRGQQGDALAGAVNLSPFYIDRSAFIADTPDSYPALFALQAQRKKGPDREYVFHYIDADINHDYAFTSDHELLVDPCGAVLPDHVSIRPEAMERFEGIYEQLRQLALDLGEPAEPPAPEY